jgi:hypothetical protein
MWHGRAQDCAAWGLPVIETVDGIATDVAQLAQRVLELERRVATLEGHAVSTSLAAVEAPTKTEAQPATPVAEPAEATIPSVWDGKTPPTTWKGFPSPDSPAGVFTTVGKAVLGMAGAYLLRALAESGAVPKVVVVAVAILYAAAWMVWSARVYLKSQFASVTYAATSALILVPMLWETTVRFHALAPVVTAAVLVGYVVLTLALARQHDLELAPWVATIAASVTALGLIITTHALVPMVVALLLVALASEVSSCTGHRLTQRVMAALAVDFAVWQLIDVMVLSKTVPEGYAPVSVGLVTSLCLLLLAIYGGSIGVRGYLQLGTITYFDVGQGIVAFALATFGAVSATHGGIAPVLGAAYLALAVMSYWGALSRFAPEELARNRRVSASWAAGLLVVGSWLLLPAGLQVVFLSAAAVAAAYLYARTTKFSFGWHASVYLVAAAVFSPVLTYLITALAGSEMARLPWSAWVVVLAAAASYIVGARHAETQIVRRLLWVIPALLAGFTVTALAVSAIVALAGGTTGLAASRLSMVRTIVGCAVALGLAFAGSRWRRVELGWVAYAAVAFGTLKLLLEDLRFGNPASLVVSLLFYGGVLILLPKMMQRKAVASSQ